MFNYCIFIIVWSGWVLVVAAWSLAIMLGKAFREPLSSSEHVEVTDAATPNPVLEYARVAKKLPACRKRPWLAGASTLVESLFLLTVALSPPILLWWTIEIARPYAYAAAVVGTLTLVSILIVVRRGLRQTNGVPTAVNWPRRKLRIASICGLLVCALTLVVLDMGTKQRMQRVRDEMNAQSQSLYIPVPPGTTNAANVYRDAFALISGANPKLPDWSSRYSDDQPTAPPALSADLEKAVSLLHTASQLPVVDWGINPTSYTYMMTTSPPHLKQLRSSANLLYIHAAREAQAGRIDSAIRDIQTIRAIARHAGQGQTLIEGLVALGIDAAAYASMEDVIPFVVDERHLDQLAVQHSDWHQKLRSRMLRGEQASCLRGMADIYDGKMLSLSSTATALAATPINLPRVFHADTDIETLQYLYNEIAVMAAQDPTKAVADLRAFDAQLPRLQKGGFFTSTLISSVSRVALKSIEAELLEDLSAAGLASRRMYLRTGRLPTTLDELVSAGLLKSVPTDPFSGKPIRAKLKEGEFVVYSVGQDGRDNGGDSLLGKDVTFRVGNKPLWEIDQAMMKNDALREEIEQAMMKNVAPREEEK